MIDTMCPIADKVRRVLIVKGVNCDRSFKVVPSKSIAIRCCCIYMPPKLLLSDYSKTRGNYQKN